MHHLYLPFKSNKYMQWCSNQLPNQLWDTPVVIPQGLRQEVPRVRKKYGLWTGTNQMIKPNWNKLNWDEAGSHRLQSVVLHEPHELKTLFEALAIAPSYLSRRFILKEMLGWSDEDLANNLKLVQEDSDTKRMNSGKGY